MPITATPIERIAMNVVGPLPGSRAGKKYILTICDYTTRYPEVIALPSIETSRIANELVNLFARVGMPAEILTDQGTDFSMAQKSTFSELCRLAHLILVMPATNAVSECSFSAMRRLKTYLCSTMCQGRLNHVTLLNMNHEKVDQLDIDVIADEFVQGDEHHLRQFGKFTANT